MIGLPPTGHRPPPLRFPKGLAPLPYALDPFQAEARDWRKGEAVVGASAGCHRIGQGVLLYDGRVKRIEDIAVGDVLCGPDSAPRTVQALRQGHGQMAQIVPVKGAPFVVNLDHVLTVELSGHRYVDRGDGGLHDITVRAYLAQGPTFHKDAKLVRFPAHFGAAPLVPFLIDPYFLGVLLGDGSFRGSVSVCKPGAAIRAVCEEQAERWGLTLRVHQSEGRPPSYVFSTGRGKGVPRAEHRNPLKDALRALGLYGKLSGERFVPEMYKRAPNLADRAAILAGLIDTDGHVSNGSVDYISQSQQLSDDVCFLARSIGLAAYMRASEKHDQNGQGGTYWRVSISGELTRLPLRNRRVDPRRQIKDVLRTGFSVQVLDDEEDYYGFTLDGDGRYLLDDFTVTHNSGKTTLLIERVLHLLAEGEPPEGVLTLAFNANAASTFRERLARRLKESKLDKVAAKRVPIFTFHAWALMVLRSLFPGDPRWKNIIGGDRKRDDGPQIPPRVRLIYQSVGREVERMKANGARRIGPKEQVLDHENDWRWWADLYDRSRDAGMLKSDDARFEWLYAKFCEPGVDSDDNALLPEWTPEFCAHASNVFGYYEALKAQYKAIDFCDMTALVAGLIDWWREQGSPSVEIKYAGSLTGGAPTPYETAHPIAALRTAYRHVQVDEAQDASSIRWKLVDHVGSCAESLIAVADPRQSIYGWNGALPERLFERLEKGAKLLSLPVNRRSTKAIVEHGNTICRGFRWHLGGDATPKAHAPDGLPVDFRVYKSDGEEARAVADMIAVELRRGEVLRRAGAADATFSVLARTNASLVPMEIALVLRDIPVYIRGRDGGVWETECGREIRGLLGGTAGFAHECLYDGATRISRYLKKADLIDVLREARQQPDGREVNGQAFLNMLAMKSRACRALSEQLADWSRLPWVARCEKIAEALVEEYPDTSGADPEVDDRRECYLALAQAAIELKDLESIDGAALAARKAAESGEAVVLSTIHKAKGLEHPVIFLIRCSHEVLPHKRAEDQEEERRLYYVACTRAMERLVVTTGGTKGPSRFLPDSVQRDWLKLIGWEPKEEPGHDVLLQVLDERRKRLEAGEDTERDHDEGDRL